MYEHLFPPSHGRKWSNGEAISDEHFNEDLQPTDIQYNNEKMQYINVMSNFKLDYYVDNAVK